MIVLCFCNYTNTLKFKYVVQNADIAYNTYNLRIICGGQLGLIAERTRELFELAEAQQGFFTAKQAKSVGYINKNHAYHLKAGHWTREERGIFRLTLFPRTPDEQKIIYSLWSQNKSGIPQGVFSHETALAHYELSDINPSKLHMTVPKSFRRNSKIPKVLKLHFADLTKEMIHESRGFFVTKIGRTLSDIIQSDWIPFDIIRQSVIEARSKGLIQKNELVSLLKAIGSLAHEDMKKQLNRLTKEIDR